MLNWRKECFWGLTARFYVNSSFGLNFGIYCIASDNFESSTSSIYIQIYLQTVDRSHITALRRIFRSLRFFTMRSIHSVLNDSRNSYIFYGSNGDAQKHSPESDCMRDEINSTSFSKIYSKSNNNACDQKRNDQSICEQRHRHDTTRHDTTRHGQLISWNTTFSTGWNRTFSSKRVNQNDKFNAIVANQNCQSKFSSIMHRSLSF